MVECRTSTRGSSSRRLQMVVLPLPDGPEITSIVPAAQNHAEMLTTAPRVALPRPQQPLAMQRAHLSYV